MCRQPLLDPFEGRLAIEDVDFDDELSAKPGPELAGQRAEVSNQRSGGRGSAAAEELVVLELLFDVVPDEFHSFAGRGQRRRSRQGPGSCERGSRVATNKDTKNRVKVQARGILAGRKC
jgi:hypothetical protein